MAKSCIELKCKCGAKALYEKSFVDKMLAEGKSLVCMVCGHVGMFEGRFKPRMGVDVWDAKFKPE